MVKEEDRVEERGMENRIAKSLLGHDMTVCKGSSCGIYSVGFSPQGPVVAPKLQQIFGIILYILYNIGFGYLRDGWCAH